MLWFFLALGCAFSETAKDLISKRAFRVLDEWVCAWAAAFFALPWVFVIVLLEGFSSVDWVFWVLAPVTAGLQVLAHVLYFRALRAANLSLVLPLISFTPLFYLATSPIIIGEYAGPYGIAGVLLIVLGSYLLNLDARAAGFFEPFRMLLKSEGARSMFGTAFIWSITGNLDKIGIAHSSMFTWFFALIGLMALGLGLLVLRNSKVTPSTMLQERTSLVAIGFFHATSSLCYVIGITLTLVAYIVSVKRLSVVLGVLWGALVLKEEKMRQRIVATALMVSGVLCITLGS